MKKICARLRDGATYDEIAVAFGISKQRVGQIREYAGIERRHKAREQGSGNREAKKAGCMPLDST